MRNNQTMRAAILYGKEDVRLETIPVPRVGAGEALVKIGAALTCGTDLKVFRRGYHATMIKPPSVFGHEFAGTVVEMVPEDRHRPKFKPGDRVVVANSAPCGMCYFCGRGQENLCEDLHFINGAYAEYLRVPSRFVEKNMHRIPDHLTFAEAAMVEPLACVVHGIEETSPRKGDVVAVLGLGPIGLMFVALLKDRGVTVIGVGRHAARLAAARALGADEVIEADEAGDWMKGVRHWAHLDVVIEATGRAETWEQAVQLVRKGGVVNLFGGCPAGSKVTLDTNRVHYDQITLKSPFHHRPSAIRAALEAISQRVVQPRQFITDEKPLEELPAILRSMLHSKTMVKTCILPGPAPTGIHHASDATTSVAPPNPPNP